MQEVLDANEAHGPSNTQNHGVLAHAHTFSCPISGISTIHHPSIIETARVLRILKGKSDLLCGLVFKILLLKHKI